MVRPEAGAVEGQGPAGKGDAGEVFDDGFIASWVDASQVVVVGAFIIRSLREDYAIDEYLAAGFVWQVKSFNDVTLCIDLQHAFVVPLANVQVRTVVAELGARIIRAPN